jgi:hypothetical protein
MTEEVDKVFEALAATIAETMKVQSSLDQLQRRIVALDGKQEALFGLWLEGEEIKPQEAYETNYRGLKDRVKELME